MSVQHYLFGYDKDGAALRVEFPIKPDQLDAVKHLLVPCADDPDWLDPYPLDATQVVKIGGIIGSPVDAGQYDWFLQAFAAETAPAGAVKRSAA
jgi:hypothetical protein